jgi:hypothetical protein
MQPMNRRQRRMQEKDSRKEKPEKKVKAAKAKVAPADAPTGVTGPKKRVVAENGKILVVDAVGNVYLEQRNDEGEMQELLLDVSPRLSPVIPFYIYQCCGNGRTDITSPLSSNLPASATQLSSASPSGSTPRPLVASSPPPPLRTLTPTTRRATSLRLRTTLLARLAVLLAPSLRRRCAAGRVDGSRRTSMSVFPLRCSWGFKCKLWWWWSKMFVGGVVI